jgi:glucose-6-phosphate-specific signal transduction histidine kinase
MLRARADELLALSQATSAALHEAQQRNKALAAKNAQMAIDREQLRATVASVTEDCERQQTLMATRLKAIALAKEASCHNQVEEAKAQIELDKRRIFAAVANRLRQFYNPRSELDDAEFTRIIACAADELARLSVQDTAVRRLLGIDLTENPEASISKLIQAACRRN